MSAFLSIAIHWLLQWVEISAFVLPGLLAACLVISAQRNAEDARKSLGYVVEARRAAMASTAAEARTARMLDACATRLTELRTTTTLDPYQRAILHALSKDVQEIQTLRRPEAVLRALRELEVRVQA